MSWMGLGERAGSATALREPVATAPEHSGWEEREAVMEAAEEDQAEVSMDLSFRSGPTVDCRTLTVPDWRSLAPPAGSRLAAPPVYAAPAQRSVPEKTVAEPRGGGQPLQRIPMTAPDTHAKADSLSEGRAVHAVREAEARMSQAVRDARASAERADQQMELRLDRLERTLQEQSESLSRERAAREAQSSQVQEQLSNLASTERGARESQQAALAELVALVAESQKARDKASADDRSEARDALNELDSALRSELAKVRTLVTDLDRALRAEVKQETGDHDTITRSFRVLEADLRAELAKTAQQHEVQQGSLRDLIQAQEDLFERSANALRSTQDEHKHKFQADLRILEERLNSDQAAFRALLKECHADFERNLSSQRVVVTEHQSTVQAQIQSIEESLRRELRQSIQEHHSIQQEVRSRQAALDKDMAGQRSTIASSIAVQDAEERMQQRISTLEEKLQAQHSQARDQQVSRHNTLDQRLTEQGAQVREQQRLVEGAAEKVNGLQESLAQAVRRLEGTQNASRTQLAEVEQASERRFASLRAEATQQRTNLQDLIDKLRRDVEWQLDDRDRRAEERVGRESCQRAVLEASLRRVEERLESAAERVIQPPATSSRMEATEVQGALDQRFTSISEALHELEGRFRQELRRIDQSVEAKHSSSVKMLQERHESFESEQQQLAGQVRRDLVRLSDELADQIGSHRRSFEEKMTDVCDGQQSLRKESEALQAQCQNAQETLEERLQQELRTLRQEQQDRCETLERRAHEQHQAHEARWTSFQEAEERSRGDLLNARSAAEAAMREVRGEAEGRLAEHAQRSAEAVAGLRKDFERLLEECEARQSSQESLLERLGNLDKRITLQATAHLESKGALQLSMHEQEERLRAELAEVSSEQRELRAVAREVSESGQELRAQRREDAALAEEAARQQAEALAAAEERLRGELAEQREAQRELAASTRARGEQQEQRLLGLEQQASGFERETGSCLAGQEQLLQGALASLADLEARLSASQRAHEAAQADVAAALARQQLAHEEHRAGTEASARDLSQRLEEPLLLLEAQKRELQVLEERLRKELQQIAGEGASAHSRINQLVDERLHEHELKSRSGLNTLELTMTRCTGRLDTLEQRLSEEMAQREERRQGFASKLADIDSKLRTELSQLAQELQERLKDTSKKLSDLQQGDARLQSEIARVAQDHQALESAAKAQTEALGKRLKEHTAVHTEIKATVSTGLQDLEDSTRRELGELTAKQQASDLASWERQNTFDNQLEELLRGSKDHRTALEQLLRDVAMRSDWESLSEDLNGKYLALKQQSKELDDRLSDQRVLHESLKASTQNTNRCLEERQDELRRFALAKLDEANEQWQKGLLHSTSQQATRSAQAQLAEQHGELERRVAGLAEDLEASQKRAQALVAAAEERRLQLQQETHTRLDELHRSMSSLLQEHDERVARHLASQGLRQQELQEASTKALEDLGDRLRKELEAVGNDSADRSASLRQEMAQVTRDGMAQQASIREVLQLQSEAQQRVRDLQDALRGLDADLRAEALRAAAEHRQHLADISEAFERHQFASEKRFSTQAQAQEHQGKDTQCKLSDLEERLRTELVRSLGEQAASLRTAQSQQEQRLASYAKAHEDSRRGLDAAHLETRELLQKSHAELLHGLRDQREAHSAALEQLRVEHDKVQVGLRRSMSDLDAELKKQSSSSRISREDQDEILRKHAKDLKEDHAQRVQELQAKLEGSLKEQSRAASEMRKALEAAIQDVEVRLTTKTLAVAKAAEEASMASERQGLWSRAVAD